MESTYKSTWQAPGKTDNSYITGLHVNNSFCFDHKKLVEFIPLKGRQVKWYMCGPTVYDHSHLGHARTYIGFDAIRRTLRDYFNYDLLLCMNITNIDDKIINRSNELKEDFTEFARRWENEFFTDMKALGVEVPDIITRVSEFVPEIIEYIEVLIKKEYAYPSNGSVYFNVSKYVGDNNVYGKLEPWSVNDKEKLKEGEGNVNEEEAKEKKNDDDFVLWKRSKPGEPKWPSPWGEGRPGWHIECSVMAKQALGETLDIHSGGVDLRFPHHDNEIAQAEAFHGCKQWINYFLHTGHLNIAGLKMSKSKKNFITIKQFLTKFSPRTMRLLFLMHKYDSLMDYDEEKSIEQAHNKEKRFLEFYRGLKVVLRQNPITLEQKWAEKEFDLQNAFVDAKTKIHAALSQNFNYPTVLNELDSLMKAVNTYTAKPNIKFPLIQSIGSYTKFIFKCLGLNYGGDDDGESTVGLSNAEKENVISPYLDILTKFRDQDSKRVLEVCDELRDDLLPHVGVRLEDKAIGTPSIWKYEDREVLLKERQDKIEEREKKEKEKAKRDEEKLKKDKEKKEKEDKLREQAKIPPKELFTTQTDQYSQFDENGFPTHDTQGAPLSLSKAKKLKKELEAHEKLHADWLAGNTDK